MQLGSDVQDRGPHRIARAVTGTSDNFKIQVGNRVSWSGTYYATPADARLDARDIVIDTPVGCAPAWWIDGDTATWAVHIHGLSSTRAGTLRGVQVATELGLTSLVVSYRNDGDGPRVGNGRSTLGATEVDDVDAAIGYAIRRGAEKIVLFGWSLGAAIAVQLAHRPKYRGLIVGLVFDSPVLNWGEVIKANCKRAGLPKFAGTLAIPWLTLGPLAHMLDLPSTLPLDDMDWVARAHELIVPTLILHSFRDDSVPIGTSTALLEKRPDLVELEIFDAGHTLVWNSDFQRWRSTIDAWYTKHLGCVSTPS